VNRAIQAASRVEFRKQGPPGVLVRRRLKSVAVPPLFESTSSVRLRTPRAITAMPPMSMCRPAPVSARTSAPIAEESGCSANSGRSSHALPREVERKVLLFASSRGYAGSECVAKVAKVLHTREHFGEIGPGHTGFEGDSSLPTEATSTPPAAGFGACRELRG